MTFQLHVGYVYGPGMGGVIKHCISLGHSTVGLLV